MLCFHKKLKLNMKVLPYIFILLAGTASAQTESPYKTSFKVDAPAIAVGVGLTALGVSQMKNKTALTAAEASALTKNDVNGFDRGTAGNYSESADNASYIPFYASFAMPVVMLLNKNEGSKAGQIMALYVETMAATGAIYTLTAGNVYRNRPFVYGTEALLSKRTDKDARRAFFAGHTAATASATFFAAKVFQDFNPDSKARPYVWAAAAAVPAVVGYYRMKAGMHFLSDNIVGYAVGAGVGVLVPQLHKKTVKGDFSVVPMMAPGYHAAALTYTF
ncbi:MAG: PA-phosphatase [Sphingobacteriaceae bacterium]|jgi:membrane-associated phospholipid phosphatase|nr:PA-phosphatase [Sphingobacteriaceae bacterium]